MLNDIEDIRFTARSEENLRGVHPDLVRVIRLALRYSLVPFSVSEGLRSMARQREMVRAGSSQTLRSRHLTGHAVDVVRCRRAWFPGSGITTRRLRWRCARGA